MNNNICQECGTVIKEGGMQTRYGWFCNLSCYNTYLVD